MLLRSERYIWSHLEQDTSVARGGGGGMGALSIVFLLDRDGLGYPGSRGRCSHSHQVTGEARLKEDFPALTEGCACKCAWCIHLTYLESHSRCSFAADQSTSLPIPDLIRQWGWETRNRENQLVIQQRWLNGNRSDWTFQTHGQEPQDHTHSVSEGGVGMRNWVVHSPASGWRWNTW